MSALNSRDLCRLGSHRVIEPRGALPQAAWKLDSTPVAMANEILFEVEALNIDSASFRQIAECCKNDEAAICEHICETVRERGKQHNAVTGSGGMFVGRVSEIGSSLQNAGLRVGDRVASLVSLTLTPLHIERVERLDVQSGRLWVKGTAVLFESGLFAKLPDDIETDVALAVLDVAGAPAQVRRLTRPGSTVIVVGADGKSGMLACAQAKESGGPQGRVIGIVPDANSASSRLLLEIQFVDQLIEADARDARALQRRVAEVVPDLADLVVNCVNCCGTELGSILCCKEGGTVYFFSMATSFSAAALGAEGVGKDVTMIIGNGYTRGHAEIALQMLRDHPRLHQYFSARYGSSQNAPLEKQHA